MSRPAESFEPLTPEASVRGRCPACGGSYVLRQDGRLHWHCSDIRPSSSRFRNVCPGAGKAPGPTIDLMAALRASLDAARAGRPSDGAAPTPVAAPVPDPCETCGGNGCPACDELA